LPEQFAFTTDIELVTRHGQPSPFVTELIHQVDVQLGPVIPSEPRPIERQLPNV